MCGINNTYLSEALFKVLLLCSTQATVFSLRAEKSTTVLLIYSRDCKLVYQQAIQLVYQQAIQSASNSAGVSVSNSAG